ncbi:MAG: c-type cytochrome [Candidatus Sericytochromatia bacterium]
MKKVILLGTFLGILSGCFGHRVGPADDLKIEKTPERIKRGEYLFNNVASCLDCHSKHDYSKFASPVIEGTDGMGGVLFGKEEGLPGDIYSSNITPSALGTWTDGEIVRAITAGVSKDNTPLFPLMPYHYFGKMDKEDIFSIVSYIRTLKPIKNEIPKRTLDFPLNIIVNSMPQNPEFSKIPDKNDNVNYGKYLVNTASCIVCHTKTDKGQPIKGLEFSGGEKFKLKGLGTVISANITPDKETGIGEWSKDTFIKKFKSYNPYNIKKGDIQTVMPWYQFKNMTESDLGSIYDYLRTIPSIKNNTDKRFIEE